MERIHSVKFAILPSTAFIMAAVAGFVDVIGFVGVNKLFTAHVTGNIIIAISEIVHHEPGVLPKVIAIPLFVLVVGITTWVIEKWGQTKRQFAAWLFIEALFLLAFMLAGVYVLPDYSFRSWQYIFSAMLAVTAMAIHNTLNRTFMTLFPPGTVMTGNLTQIVIDSVSYFWRKSLPYHTPTPFIQHGEISRFGHIFLGFVLGGILAAIGYMTIGFWSVSVTVILLLLMTLKLKG